MTNILTLDLIIYTDCKKSVDGKEYYPKEIRSAVNRNDVILECNDVKELERLKSYIERTMNKR